MTDDTDPTITVEDGVEPADDAIDIEQLLDEHGEEDGIKEMLRRLGASEEQIEATMDWVDDDFRTKRETDE